MSRFFAYYYFWIGRRDCQPDRYNQDIELYHDSDPYGNPIPYLECVWATLLSTMHMRNVEMQVTRVVFLKIPLHEPANSLCLQIHGTAFYHHGVCHHGCQVGEPLVAKEICRRCPGLNVLFSSWKVIFCDDVAC